MKSKAKKSQVSQVGHKVASSPILIKVSVVTSASKESVKKEDSNRLLVQVREPATENRANARVLEIVRSLYPHSRVKIIKGHHKGHKIIEIT